jgi:hypothetical protein
MPLLMPRKKTEYTIRDFNVNAKGKKREARSWKVGRRMLASGVAQHKSSHVLVASIQFRSGL